MVETTSWQKLTGDDYIKAVNAVNAVLSKDIFSIKSSVMQTKQLSFYKNFKMLQATELNAYPRCVINFLYNGQDVVKLDYSANPIARVNQTSPLELDASNLGDYLKFFFASIRGKNNEAFYLVEKLSDVPLKLDADEEIEQSITKAVSPFKTSQKDADNFNIDAFIVHQNNLYDAQINVSLDGTVTIMQETIVMSDLPIQKNMLK